jgi:opacity protein-like surface antigen
MKRLLCYRAAALVCALLYLASESSAQPIVERAELTPFIAYGFGGGFQDAASGADLDIQPASTLGFIVGIPWEENSQLELYVSRQATRVATDGAAATSPPFDLSVEYYHLGGTVMLDPVRHFEPFFVATLGATRFDPQGGNLSSEIRFSFSAGLGAKYRLSERLSLRLEGRAFFTTLESDSTIFCNLPGTCDIRVHSEVLIQGQALLGLAYRF